MSVTSWIQVGAALAVGLVALASGPGPARGQAEEPGEDDASPFVGTWKGDLDVMGNTLPLVFHVDADGDSLSATMDSPAQGATDIPVKGVTVRGDTLRLDVAVINAEYEGTLTAEQDSIAGEWRQNGQTFPLTVGRAEPGDTGMNRPQHPEPPFPYATEEVTFQAEGGPMLAGTMSIPEGDGPHPGIVLISGSGPQARDSEVAGHKLFAVVADELTRQGIAVLRYDERGMGESGGAVMAASLPEMADDARAALQALSGHDAVDAERVGFYGHSEGGLVAPMAAQEASAAFLVLLAPPAVPGTELIPEQSVQLLKASGDVPASQANALRTQQERLMNAVAAAPDSAAAADSARTILSGLGVNGDRLDAQVDALTRPAYLYVLRNDPADVFRTVDVPVLALFAEKDRQVPPSQNAGPARRALQSGDSPSVTVDVIPGANHLFQPSETGSPSEYAQIETTMMPEVLERVASWIRER